ncbi:MAG: hypothetical protein PHF86_04175 [Candidatus Nanoarchaeia archaeon]|jgi:hypothetical protein|nr:hypothetical protein [Candidatus Nanoarchaeia archaeon]
MLSPSKKLLKKKFDFKIRSIAIKGADNIRSELKKRGQEADVSYSIKNNTINFVVEPKIENLKTEDIANKQVLKGLENIPVELLNEEITAQQFSTTGIEKAMERTQEQAGKKIQDSISKLI